MSTEKSPKPRRRGIYLLPNAFTTAALFSGFYAIVQAMDEHYESAAIAIFIAMILDGADGRVARMTGTESAFGAEYDSLSDVVSFGLAPALVVYQWSLQGLGKLGWCIAFFYAAATALRLARFNTQLGIADKRYFQGLPCPPAAAVVAGLIWFANDQGIRGDSITPVAVLLTVFSGILMVSNVRYYSFKDLDLSSRVPFMNILLMLSVFLLISVDPPAVLFLTALVFAVSGPTLTLIHIRRRRALRRSQGAVGEESKSTKP
jgi:CDP-diacylglycerol--serine O-phosphatidyltransferase